MKSNGWVSHRGRVWFHRAVVPAVLICLTTPATAEDEAASLQGNWRAKSVTRNGKPAEDVVGHRLTFRKKRFVIRSKDGMVVYRGTYTVGRDARPRAIDFKHQGDKLKGMTWKGIYEQKGDRLTICDNAPDVKKPRPKKLAAPADSGYVLLVFERIKK